MHPMRVVAGAARARPARRVAAHLQLPPLALGALAAPTRRLAGGASSRVALGLGAQQRPRKRRHWHLAAAMLNHKIPGKHAPKCRPQALPLAHPPSMKRPPPTARRSTTTCARALIQPVPAPPPAHT